MIGYAVPIVPPAFMRADMWIFAFSLQKLQDECDGKEGSGIDFSSSSVLLDSNDGAVISPFASGHVTAGSELPHSIISHTYALNPRACIGDPLR